MQLPIIEKKEKILVTVFIIVAGFFTSVAYHYVQASYLGKAYPYNTFLFDPGDRFKDFIVISWVNADLNPYLGAVSSAQYPLVNLIGHRFSLIPWEAAFALYAAIICIPFLFFSSKYLRTGNCYQDLTSIFVICFMTYPFLFTMDRGNYEALLFIFLLAFLYFYKRGSKLSIFFLALATAMKLYPALLLLLFVCDNKYREILYCLAGVILITLFSLMCFNGGLVDNISFLVSGSNISATNNLIVFLGNNNFVQRGVSLFTFCKICLIEAGIIQNIDMQFFLNSYLITVFLLFIPIVAYIILIEKQLWKRVAILVFLMLLFPHISGDYKLILLYLPLFLFISSQERSKLDWIYVILFGVLMIPKDYYIFQKTISDNLTLTEDISIAVLINIVIMVALMLLIIISGLMNRIISLSRSSKGISGSTI